MSASFCFARCVACLVLLLVCSSAQAAVCSWNVASGDWDVVGNWMGCSDTPGPSTRTPSAVDSVLISTGAASFNVNATVAEFEIGAGATLTLTGAAERTLTVNNALRLDGGALSTSNTTSFPFLRVILAAGGTGLVLSSSTLANTVELENRGLLQLMSPSGTALNVLGLSRVINVSGATFALGGGNARLHLDGLAPFSVRAGATLATSGNVFIGKTIVGPGDPHIESFGSITHVGPGTLTVARNGSSGAAAILQMEGLLSISNGSVLCNDVLGHCRHLNGSNGSAPLRIELSNGTYSLGGPTGIFNIPQGSRLTGSGVVDGRPSSMRGLVAPGADGGPPYAGLSITGAVVVDLAAELRFDLAGSAPGSFDTLSIGGNARFPGPSTTLRLQLASGFAPALDTIFPLVTYASVLTVPGADGEPLFDLVDSNYPLSFATRFTPTTLQVFPAPRIAIDDASLIEGNSGSAVMTLAVRLSQPSSQTVTATLTKGLFGTATDGPPPDGDYVVPGTLAVTFAPGEILRSVSAQISGDVIVEADEAFSLNLLRNNVQNAAFGNGVRGALSASGTIITDDLPVGTRFVLVGKDSATANIRRYTTTGTFIDTWNTQQPNAFGLPNTGQCFAPNGDVLATRFAHTSPIRFSRQGALRNGAFGGSQAFNFNRHESCVFDRAGNVYIGQAGFDATQTDAQVPVLKFNPSGVLLDSFVMPTGPRGTDWIDLASDQCTLYYTSEDTTVRRYDLCARTPLPPLITTLSAPFCYALRLRPNRELMVACQEAVHRVSAQGINLQTYTRQSIGETNAQGLFAINLDPDGTSFWTAGGLSGNVYRVDIASGAVLTTFNSGAGGVSGLSVYDELFDTSSDVLFADGFEVAPNLSVSAVLIYPVAAPCIGRVHATGAAMSHYGNLPWLASLTTPACAN